MLSYSNGTDKNKVSLKHGFIKVSILMSKMFLNLRMSERLYF